MRETGRNQEAKDELLEMLSWYADDGSREVEMLIQLVNTRARLGEFTAAIDDSEQALAICERQELSEYLPRVQYLLGWMHRYVWKWNESLAWYDKCLNTSAQVGNNYLAAAALSDAAFIRAQQGEYKRAIMDAEMALAIRKRTEDKQDDGLSQNILGIINRYAGRYDTAFKHYEQALNLFTKLGDEEWIAIVLQQLGINKFNKGKIYQDEGDTERAQKIFQDGLADLRRAIEIGERLNIVKDLPRGYHRIAHLYDALGEEKQAIEHFRKSYDLALDIKHYQTALDSLVELMQLDCKGGKCDLASYLKAIEKFQGMPQYGLFRAMMRIVQADVDYMRGDYHKALATYKEAYMQAACDQGFGAYLLPRKLDNLKDKLQRLDVENRMNWCKELEQYWTQEGLEEVRPEIIAMVRNLYLDAMLQRKQED